MEIVGDGLIDGKGTIGTLIANGFLYPTTAGLLTTTSAATNGQLLIGSTGGAPVAASITAGAGINVTNGAGTITLSTVSSAPGSGYAGIVSYAAIGTSTTTSQFSSTATPTTSSGAQIASITVTPASASSQFFLTVDIYADFSANNHNITLAIFRGTTLVGLVTGNIATSGRPITLGITSVDAPATTSTITYTVRVGTDAGGTTTINRNNGATFNAGISAFVITEIR
jgi:trimeric autotransporter adhesin